MSCDIREYESLNLGRGFENMKLTSFCGGKKNGLGLQFTMGINYCALPEKAIRDLIKTIQKRLKCKKGYSGTDSERKNIRYGT